EVIIDNGGAGTSYTGTWAVSGALNPYGKDSVYGRGGATYTWKANLPQTGVYEVYVWWTEYSSRSTNAPVKITHSGGADTVRVNQQVNGGKWSYLGTYSFDAAAGGTVMLTAESPSPVSYSADAVKFVLVNGGNLPPIAVIDSLSPNPARTGDTVTFTGHGTDSDGTVTGYNWRSSIDGNLGTEASLSTAGLTPGTHTIFFKVNDDDGAWSPEVSADLSVDQFPSEIIVDNGDAGTSSTGLWKVSGAPNPYGKDSLYSRETATYTWHADLPQAGAYEVYVWWTEYSSRSDYAPVTIQYDNGSEVVRVNQQVNGGKWNYLGTYSFDTVKGGTVTLTSGDPYADSYSADAVKFVYTDQPFVGIVRPQSYDLQGGTSLTAKAEARNVQGGWKVQFILDRDTPGEQAITDGTDPYEVTFTGLTKGEHTLDALLLDAADKEVPGTFTRDRNIQIGVGDYYVAMGDSITYGDSDDYPQDDISNDGRNSGGGYEPILNSLRTAYLGYSQTVINEGVNATRSYNGASSAGGILAKHPDAKYFLIMYGTNDSASKIPSGLGLQPGSQGYANSYKDYMQRIITAVLDTGKVPVIAKIPVVYGDCPSCTRYADPQNASRNVLIREYNKVIDELVKENKLTIQGPDMYAYFSVYPEEFSDTTHPNGKGYQSMADLWHDALP
ncbi:MAG: hypothetical protein K8I29_10845, partial [Alphaproteobacteria bacterium]|nr:hypothetical protein [Candidatus Nitrobium versatile]